jgi:hypothetical protein
MSGHCHPTLRSGSVVATCGTDKQQTKDNDDEDFLCGAIWLE